MLKPDRASLLFVCLFACLLPLPSAAAKAPAVLIENVYLFDGKSDRRSAQPVHVLVRDGQIATIATRPITPEEGVQVVDGEQRTLMPGLIDAHWHSVLVSPTTVEALTADIAYIHLLAGQVAEATLMRGFTSVRDMGGPSFGLRRAIEEGLISGPRIFPSGAMVSQTGGHGDFRLPYEVPRAGNSPLNYSDQVRVTAIADGSDEVLRKVREQLMMGATQIKLMAGGGVSSLYDPIDVTQYTPDELRAAVLAAENWGTYVAVHAYTSRAVQMALEAGVKSIEHGQLLDEETVRMIASKNAWWSLQPFLDNELANPQTGASRVKQLMVSTGTERAFDLAKKHKVKVAFGTDILASGDTGDKQNRLLVTLERWYNPGEVLQIATGNNGQLIGMAGERYGLAGPLGVLEEGAMADMLLVDGDPTADLSLIADPDKNFVLIMKNGVIYKNLLP
ncbi:amidohydrolase family protein [Halopseudomonas phragmitis]|uniref:Hydrolase n=2 Tax=Pseudomonadaceae TaxID=135621 RepID=A0A1V0B6Z9_9GAMM|nr:MULTISPECIES: amidohydrolase family protein [Pseudomonadaceae]AQZ95661.1 hydrolase [Halopseudomonas phragmitis]RHW22628.1 amidohydrolase family protein [Pseudomonas jilinensis]